MLLRILPGPRISGTCRVPGDKSIAHRWLIFAATAQGASRLVGVPVSLDVRSTAACLAEIAPKARPSLNLWLGNSGRVVEGSGSTWNTGGSPLSEQRTVPVLEVEGEGREAISEPASELDCGNSGTSMRLLAGLVAAAPIRVALSGDTSLSTRPMERVAEPLRMMGASVRTTEGHAPITVVGGALEGIEYRMPVPSAQIKSAVLLAGLHADGDTLVREGAGTRDHTERAISALGGPIQRANGIVSVRRFQHDGFAAAVPGDPSSAMFVLAGAALTGGEVEVEDVGLNPTRLRALEVMRRMGLDIETRVDREELGEPVGSISLGPTTGLTAVRVEADELPLVIDEVPVLAALAAHAEGGSRFLGAGELRVKESDRLRALVTGLRALGGQAADEGDDLVVAGGGLGGGTADGAGDHRIAMALAVASLAADARSSVSGIEAAGVSYPGFWDALRALGADVELER